MATTLHLIRHGQATDEEGGDPGLSPLGVHQAGAVADRLIRCGAGEIVHSPKRRAVETARIIAERIGVTMVASPLVDDRTPIPENAADVPARFHAFLDMVPFAERDPGGHQLDAAAASLSAVDGGDRRLVVVTHNFVIGWFVRRALDSPWWRWLGLNQDNGALTTIMYNDNGAWLVTYNDSGHLPSHRSA